MRDTFSMVRTFAFLFLSVHSKRSMFGFNRSIPDTCPLVNKMLSL